MVVFVRWNDTNVTPTVTDNASGGSNSYGALTKRTEGGSVYGQIFYAYNCKAATTITVNFSSWCNLISCVVSEFSGILTTDPFDYQNGHTGWGDTGLNSGNMTASTEYSLVVGQLATYDVVASYTGSGYTNLYSTGSYGIVCEYKIVTSSGTYQATGSIESGGNYVLNGAVFKGII